jgi:hypothetical protein
MNFKILLNNLSLIIQNTHRMKKNHFFRIVTFGFLAFSFVEVKAQPTITRAGFGMQIGASIPITISTPASVASANYSGTGASFTWNCIGLVDGNGGTVINYQGLTNAGTPFAADYPNANFVLTDPSLAALVGYDYSHISNDSLVSWGTHTAGQSYEIFSNPEKQFIFPLTFGQTFVDSYQKTNYNASGAVTSNQTGIHTITYDGHGTLILPSGSFTNVARLKDERTNSLGPNTTDYIFLDLNTGLLVMVVNDDAIADGIIYTVSSPSSIQSATNGKEEISINLINGDLRVQSPLEINRVELFDGSGAKKYESHVNELNSFQAKIELNPGIYFLRVSTEHGVITKKVIAFQ